MKFFTWGIVFISLITLALAAFIAFNSLAQEQWHSIKTESLASEPIENYMNVEKEVLADLVKNISSYNKMYVEGAEMRANELKWVIYIQSGCIWTLIVMLFLIKRKMAIKHV